MTDINWTAHPIKQNPVKSAMLIAILLLVILIIHISFESIFMTVVSGLLLFSSLYKFFVPTRYTLTETEVIVETPAGKTVRTWEMFKSYYPDQNGILLSPFEGKSALESFRGIYLMKPQAPVPVRGSHTIPPKREGGSPLRGGSPHRDDVIAFIDKKIKRQ